MSFFLEIVKLGLSNLRRHLLRSVLTALGIILGVAAVITNSSIGEGAKREALDQIERLGAKNIIIRSVKPPESAQSGGGRGRTGWVARYGLSRDTLRVLQAEFPGLEAIVPLKAVGGQILREALRQTSQAYGVTPGFAEAAQLRVARGRYLTASDMDERAMVCVLGSDLARTMFPFDDPLGQTLRVDAKALKVVGILEKVSLAGGAGNMLVGRDMNFDLHLPLSTSDEVFGDIVFRTAAGSMSSDNVQVSEIYCVAPQRDQVVEYSDRIRRVLEVRHPGMTDVQMIVPFQLLEQAERTALTWNLILTAIAGISLLVGGIGIMNIMLASVTERTREIGIRRALGATRRHVMWQFLVETGVLSALGGLIGVGVGLGLSVFIPVLARNLHDLPLIGDQFGADMNLPTVLSLFPILTAFLVAALTGLVFGLYPAWRAAKQDPIVALRHD